MFRKKRVWIFIPVTYLIICGLLTVINVLADENKRLENCSPDGNTYSCEFMKTNIITLSNTNLTNGRKATAVLSSNLLLNGSFEFGLCDWVPAKNCSFVERGVHLYATAPYEGKFCLAVPNKDIRYSYNNERADSGGHLLSNLCPAEPGHDYYLTIAMKGSNEGQQGWFRLLDGKVMNARWKSSKKRVALDREWKVFTFKQRVPANLPINKLAVEISMEPGAEFWVDAVKLTKDAPANANTQEYDLLGVMVDTGRDFPVFNYGENADIILRAVNSGNKKHLLSINYKIKDAFGEICKQGSFSANLNGGATKEQSVEIDTMRRGRFELYTRVRDESKGGLIRKKRTSFVVMKPVAMKRSSPIGISGDFSRLRGRSLDDNVRLLTTYGYSWRRVWFAWKFAEPFDNGAKGSFDWSEFDRQVNCSVKYNLNMQGLLLVKWEPKNRTSFRMKYFYGPGFKDRKTDIPENRDFRRWNRFVEATVKRYADKIDYWSIHNEPSMYPPESLAWYNALVAATYPVIKKFDPDSLVIACSPGDNGKKKVWNSHLYVEDFLKNGGGKYCDMIGLHPYTGTASPIWSDLQGTLDQIKGWIKKYGGRQKVIMTEAGNYNTIGGYYQEGNNLSQANRQVQCWLIAWANKTRHFQHDATPAFHSRRSCYDPVFIPNETFCAANVLADFFNSSDYDSCKWLEIPRKFDGMYGFRFTLGNDMILALWTAGLPEKRLLRLPVDSAKISLTDLMGNPINQEQHGGKSYIPVGPMLIYVRIHNGNGINTTKFLGSSEEVVVEVSNDAMANVVGQVFPGEVHAVGYVPPPEGPFELDKDGFIKDWLLIGPFANPGERGMNAGFDFDFLKPIGGEALIRLRPQMSVFYKFPPSYEIPHREVAAKSCHFETGYIDLSKVFLPYQKTVGYAYTQITVSDEVHCTLSVGSDDGIKVWVNGKEVLKRRVYRGAYPDQDQNEIILKKGVNRLMLKVDTVDGGWGFYCRIIDERGHQLKDIKIGW